MNKDEIKEKLTLYRNLIIIFWTSAFVLGGGLFNLIYRVKNFYEIIGFSIGIIFEICLIIITLNLIFRCKKLIKQLKEFS